MEVNIVTYQTREIQIQPKGNRLTSAEQKTIGDVLNGTSKSLVIVPIAMPSLQCKLWSHTSYNVPTYYKPSYRPCH